MITRAIQTERIAANECTVTTLLDKYLPALAEGSVLALTSKVVALCEGAVVPIGSVARDDLIIQEADQYALLPRNHFGTVYTVIQNTLVPNAGVDESNADGVFVLWPRDPQATANAVRAYLRTRFGLHKVGVVITDSTVRPLRWGAGGISIGHSGFKELRDYRGETDLYGRKLTVETSSISGGLAAAAALVMGDGAERQPLAVLEDLPFVEFQDHDPTAAELEQCKITIHNDLYAPILQAVSWQPGGQASKLRGSGDASAA